MMNPYVALGAAVQGAGLGGGFPGFGRVLPGLLGLGGGAGGLQVLQGLRDLAGLGSFRPTQAFLPPLAFPPLPAVPLFHGLSSIPDS